MKRAVIIVLITSMVGCAHPSADMSDEVIFGSSLDYPTWVLYSEIPEELRKVHEAAPKSASSAESSDSFQGGAPLYYIRIAAIVVPHTCFEAAQRNAAPFIEQLEKGGMEIIVPKLQPCNDTTENILLLCNVLKRTFMNNPVTMWAESFSDTRPPDAHFYATKPVATADGACDVLFAMQGIDEENPVGSAKSATWHVGGTANLVQGKWHSEWTTTKSGKNHVLALMRLERVTHGEKWIAKAD